MKGIKCPHCNYVHEDWWELIDFEEEEQEFDMECEDCEEKFHVSMRTVITFDTKKV